MADKTILLKIDLDASSLVQGAKMAEDNIKRLTPELEKVAKESGKNSLEFRKLNAEVKANQKTLNDNATALQRYETLQKTNNGSLKEMRLLLSASKVAYAELTKEQRDNVDIGGKMVREMDELNEALLEAEKQYGTHTRNVGNYAGGVAGLKQEIRELKGMMANLDAGSEEYQQAAIKAGELNDKLKEVNEAITANTGGTGFEKLANNLGMVQGDLQNLDFAGASEKMEQMAVISKSMTFSEVLGGLKNLGSAFVSLGKTILLNPLFLIVGVIAGAVAALKIWNDSVRDEAVRAQEAHTKAIDRNIESITKQRDRTKEINDLLIRKAELEGKDIATIGKMRNDALKKENEENLRLIEEHRKKIASLKAKDLGVQASSKDEYFELVKKNNEEIKAEKDKLNELLFETKKYKIELKNLKLETDKAIEAENKAHNEKIKQQNETAYNERLALARRLSDLQLGNLELTHENERKRIEANYKFMTDTAQGNADELLRIESTRLSELANLDEKERSDREAKIRETAKREIEDAKGNAKIITEIERQRQLELDAIDIEFKARKTDRETEYTNKVLENQKLRAENEQKTADEIELIDAQLFVLRTRGTEQEIFAELKLYAVKKKQLEEQAQREIKAGKNKELAEKELQLKLRQLSDETFKKNEENLKKETALTKEEKKSLALSLVNSAGQLADSLMQISRNQIQTELNEDKEKYDEQTQLLQNQLDAGIISEENFKAQKSVLDSEYAQKERELKKRQFESNKASQLINATIATAVGVANGLAAPPPLGLITAALAGALGATQIGIIASQPTPKFEKGGVLKGRSHAQGGIPTPFGELEDGEAVINKRSTKMFMPLLSAINEAGGGKKFANGGILEPMSNNALNSMQLANMIRNAVASMPNPIVSVTDIAVVNDRMVSVAERAEF
jgi:hypothetical protein